MIGFIDQITLYSDYSHFVFILLPYKKVTACECDIVSKKCNDSPSPKTQDSAVAICVLTNDNSIVVDDIK